MQVNKGTGARMKLRTRLLWLFVPPLLLVLSLVYFAAQGMLLARLDKQDERLLVAEAERLRALLGNSFERDANRLRQWAQAMPGTVPSAFRSMPPRWAAVASTSSCTLPMVSSG